LQGAGKSEVLKCLLKLLAAALLLRVIAAFIFLAQLLFLSQLLFYRSFCCTAAPYSVSGIAKRAEPEILKILKILMFLRSGQCNAAGGFLIFSFRTSRSSIALQ
jgi:hypothetical protein